jgi:hypothetical protein
MRVPASGGGAAGRNTAPPFVPWGSCLEQHRAGGRRRERRRAAMARAMRPHMYGGRRRAIGRVDAGAWTDARVSYGGQVPPLNFPSLCNLLS